jgi:hypothetical protein
MWQRLVTIGSELHRNNANCRKTSALFVDKNFSGVVESSLKKFNEE